MEAPYGFCPMCFSPGVSRERRIDGNDACEQGHVYPTRSAVAMETLQTEELRLKNEIMKAEIDLDNLKEKLQKIRMILGGAY